MAAGGGAGGGWKDWLMDGGFLSRMVKDWRLVRSSHDLAVQPVGSSSF
jgi:hypothetical protein